MFLWNFSSLLIYFRNIRVNTVVQMWNSFHRYHLKKKKTPKIYEKIHCRVSHPDPNVEWKKFAKNKTKYSIVKEYRFYRSKSPPIFFVLIKISYILYLSISCQADPSHLLRSLIIAWMTFAAYIRLHIRVACIYICKVT